MKNKTKNVEQREGISRRNFLKTAMVTTGATAAGIAMNREAFAMKPSRAARQPFPRMSSVARDYRWGRAKELMEANNVECLIVPGIHSREDYEGYLSYDNAEGFVVFPLKGSPVHLTHSSSRIMRHREAERRGETPWISDIRVGMTGSGLVYVLKEKGLETAKIGVVGIATNQPGEPEGVMPYKTWDFVLKQLPGATFVELSDAFSEMMLVHCDEELAMVRTAARIGEEVCKVMFQMARPGANERDIYAAMMKVVHEAGVPPSPWLILHSGPQNMSWGPPMFSYQGAPARTLKKGDIIMAEIFTRYGGLETQQQMAVLLKPENPALMELAAVARRCYEAGIATIRDGITVSQLKTAMDAPVKQAGCFTLTPLFHSECPQYFIGFSDSGIVRAPGFEWVRDKFAPPAAPLPLKDIVIKAGMVIELEPNACKGEDRVNIGGAVIVTKSGVEELNKLPTKLRVK